MVYEKEIAISTGKRNDMIDITGQVRSVLKDSGLRNGRCMIFCPHTTAAITINENADPDVVHDFLLTLSELFPQDRAGYRHNEGNSDSHCKCSLVGCSEDVLVSNGALKLGTWQGIYFCEFDGPRKRRFVVQVMGE